VCPEAGKWPRELQNQPLGASLSVMFSGIQLADRRLPIVARQINHLCRGSLDRPKEYSPFLDNMMSKCEQNVTEDGDER
jgi:hypothetical protein